MRYILTLLILAGCASPQPADFSKPGTSGIKRNADARYCQTYAEANRGPATMGGLAGVADEIERRNAMFKLCMMDKGYRLI